MFRGLRQSFFLNYLFPMPKYHFVFRSASIQHLYFLLTGLIAAHWVIGKGFFFIFYFKQLLLTNLFLRK